MSAPLKGRIVSKIESIIRVPLADLLQKYKTDNLSVTEIQQQLVEQTGLSLSYRQINRWLTNLGINYSRNDAGKNRWQKGLMKDALLKSRRSLRRAMSVGSKIEELLRWEIKEELEKKKEYESIIGFSSWSILDGLEVDIPIVMIRKSDQAVYKIAIEINGHLFHSEDDWGRKKTLIQLAGWIPMGLTISGDLNNKAHQIYVKGSIKSLIDIKELISKIDPVIKSEL